MSTVNNDNLVKSHSLFTDFDITLFKSGKHYRLYQKLGAHLSEVDGKKGVYFAVWAPSASNVEVIGTFNDWKTGQHQLYVRWDESGIWEGFVEGIEPGANYKYMIYGNHGSPVEKGDPFAFLWEVPPKTASVVWDLDYKWGDSKWMSERAAKNNLKSPTSVYEVHLGSWKRHQDTGHSLSYREMADELVPYVKEMGFTHIELMPAMEHPFFGSWGYQITGYFAPSSRYGTPQDFMYLIDCFHQAGIGVILDWVPSHFPDDRHGLAEFDGSHLYEHADPKKGFHPDWNSYIFNYGRNEVRAFLISNAAFWLDYFHADGLRVDAVASMLYLDYSRGEGQWIPNEHGGRENIEAISLLKEMNVEAYGSFEGVQTIAEESTAWPGVSRPVETGGLGFGMKWMMGWMHDTLEYFKKDPVYRKFHQNDITFSLVYGFSENFMLPLSHDEVVHGKGSLLGRMPGDEWQRFANYRLLFAYMYTHPGTKLMFMGSEIAQSSEWNHDHQLDWHLLQYPLHRGVASCIKVINHLYQSQPALYQKSFEPEGFEWIDMGDSQNSILTYMRKGNDEKENLLIVANFTPQAHKEYQVGIYGAEKWKEVFNSNDSEFGGSGTHMNGTVQRLKEKKHGKDYSLKLQIPPLGITVLKGV
ncbi:MAG: 1,4-alpha-glucan branching enzyme GlgB [Cyclobacteriaceae bacterium]|nr:MAG: 1,4-alpha-glucan branching enzyme GlgB [Cyclobacteriaceae bacterium]